ncbi:histamine H2 receptor-like [Babylonia areolata]|uniref:histamine H2 receptor-like n=1 Tax=Babylonia areolata TaxID=304850 RepID=UPI003FCF6C35
MLYIPLIIFGNFLVVASICVFRRLRTLTNCFLVSLSVADLLVGLVTIPLYAFFYLKPELRYGHREACLAWFGSVILGCGASLFNLLVIVLDRFLSIHCPFWYVRQKNGRNVAVALTILWTYVLVLSSLPLMGWNHWAPDKQCNFYTTLPKAYVVLAAYLTVAVCTVASSILYAKIFATVLKHKRKIHAQTVAGKQERQWLEREVKSTRLSAVIFLLFIIFWSPYFCVGPLKYSSLSQEIVEIIKNATLMLAFANSMVNPVVYSLLQKKFRTAYTLLLTTRFTQWYELSGNVLVREEQNTSQMDQTV